jgi:cysteine desulfurase
MTRIYLDYNASTPLAPSVAKAMRDAMEACYGNPSSTHWAGEPARRLLDRSREQVASLLGCRPQEIVFTSGGSESNNFAIKGLFFARANRAAHIVTSTVEHPSVLESCRFLERLGARVTRLPVDGTGRLDPADLERAITPDTILISLMHANNEVGTIQPIAECARIARRHAVPLHTDAIQSAGKITTRVAELGVDLLSLAGHKLYAPKGVGALYVRDGVELESLIHGAGHESGRRAGTESAMLAAALGAACALAEDLSWTQPARELRDRLWNGLRERLGERIVLNGHPEHRLPNTLNVSAVGRIGPEILQSLEGVAASTGSACHSGRVEVSPVLSAMGVRETAATGAIRFSLGRGTTREEIDATVERMAAVLEQS